MENNHDDCDTIYNCLLIILGIIFIILIYVWAFI